MIYVISNVEYPEARKISPAPDDLLVFLNKAKSAAYYRDHAKKMCIRRSPKPEYGTDLEGADNRFVFSGPPAKTVPAKVIADLKKKYDWNYSIEAGKVKCATTGYMAVKYLRHLFPNEEIVLVNFGFGVRKSSYRCPWHNWRFEDRELGEFRHIYTDPPVSAPDLADRRTRVFYNLSGWLGDNVYASAVVANIAAAGFAINVSRNGHSELWKDCPFLTRSVDEDNADFVIRERYPCPWRNNAKQIIEGCTDAAAYDLSANIPVLVERPHIWMDIDSKRPIPEPYVVILAGWQNSAPTKKWAREYWSEVIRRRPDVKFVQIGQKKNHSEILPGAVNMIDKTSLRDLVRLVRDARCVISPPSGVVHIAAAFRTPVIMLSGGREPATLAAYPETRVLSVCGGGLECCRDGGCHRNHFGTGANMCAFHGRRGDEPTPTSNCMLSVTPDAVIEAMKGLA